MSGAAGNAGREGAVVRRIVIIHTGGLGDLLQIVPLLDGLRRRYPRARGALLGIPQRGRLLEAAGLVDEVRDVEGSGLHRLMTAGADTTAVPEVLREAQLVVDFLTGSSLSAALPPLTGARVIAARSFPQPGSTVLPAADYVLHQFRGPLGLPVGQGMRAETLRLAVPQICLREALAASGMAERMPPAGQKLITMHPGSGSRCKNWDLRRFAQLAAGLEVRGLAVRWLLGPAELERDEFGLLRQGDDGRCLVSDDLLAVAGVLERSAAYVGNDSGITHLAAAMGRPTVAIFGPSERAIWGPRQVNVRIVDAPGGDLAVLPVATVAAALAELAQVSDDFAASPRTL